LTDIISKTKSHTEMWVIEKAVDYLKRSTTGEIQTSTE